MRQGIGQRQEGSTLSELLVALAIVGMICAFVVTRSTATAGGLKAGTDQVVAINKLARTTAMATTTPHRVVAIDDTRLGIEYGGPCGDPAATWTPLPDVAADLPRGLTLANTTWEVCFNSQGWTTDVHEVRVMEGASYQSVFILLGGSARVEKIVRAS